MGTTGPGGAPTFDDALYAWMPLKRERQRETERERERERERESKAQIESHSPWAPYDPRVACIALKAFTHLLSLGG